MKTRHKKTGIKTKMSSVQRFDESFDFVHHFLSFDQTMHTVHHLIFQKVKYVVRYMTDSCHSINQYHLKCTLGTEGACKTWNTEIE